MTISVPSATAKEYRNVAKQKKETVSQLFRDMFELYKQQKLKDEFGTLQAYGAAQAKKLKITEKEIEKLVFEGR
jgi:dimeric dUTPase (all-alpha-NTP-PPase superfamily)